MNIEKLHAWVQGKIKWAAVGLLALGVVIGEIKTGIGAEIWKEVVFVWQFPETAMEATRINALMDQSVSLRCSHTEAPLGNGSGVLLHKWGRTYVLTACHVVDCEINETNVSRMGVYQGTNVWTGRVISHDKAHDLALLRLEGVGEVGRSVKFFPDLMIPPAGTRVFHVGNLFGKLPRSFTEGIISNLGIRSADDPEMYLDQISATIFVGSSGGGTWTIDGRYVGMVVQMAAPNVGFIIPVRRIRAWASQNDLLWIFE